MDNKKALVFAICDFLQSNIQNKTISTENKESVEIAIQCIADAFQVDPNDPKQAEAHSIKPANLESIFQVFLNTQKQVNQAQPAADATQKSKAEELKDKGNKAMAQKQFQEAIDLYTQAIALYPSNPIYFGNRAAAYSQSGDHALALKDASHALELDKDYHKAYSRLGHAHFCLGEYSESVDAYQRALAADPNNATLKASLAAAEKKLAPVSTGPSEKAMPPLGGAPGGGLDFASLMNNPGLMQMASQMMSNPAFSSMLQNPQVAEMAQNVMQNPDALKNLMGNPDIQKMANEFLKK